MELELTKSDIKTLLKKVNDEVKIEVLATKFTEYYDRHKELTIDMTELIKSTGEVVNYTVQAPFTVTNFCLFANISPYYFNKLIQLKEEENRELYATVQTIVEIIKNENVSGAMIGKYKESTVHKIHRLAEVVENNSKQVIQTINVDLGKGYVDLTE